MNYADSEISPHFQVGQKKGGGEKKSN